MVMRDIWTKCLLIKRLVGFRQHNSGTINTVFERVGDTDPKL